VKSEEIMSEQQSTPDRPDDDLPNIELRSTTFEKVQKRDPPNVLYHYTDQTGLLGILTSGELHATKVQYMNDSTEFGRVIRELDRIIDESRYPLSPRICTLRDILGKLRPEPERQPLPPLKYYERPRGGGIAADGDDRDDS
jgi:hypothetical protein